MSHVMKRGEDCRNGRDPVDETFSSLEPVTGTHEFRQKDKDFCMECDLDSEEGVYVLSQLLVETALHTNSFEEDINMEIAHWTLKRPAGSILDLAALQKDVTPPELYKEEFEQIIGNHSDHYPRFTDRSKDETCVGAACHSSVILCRIADKCCGISAKIISAVLRLGGNPLWFFDRYSSIRGLIRFKIISAVLRSGRNPLWFFDRYSSIRGLIRFKVVGEFAAFIAGYLIILVSQNLNEAGHPS
ncbi:hypothetical protein EGW08_019496 [Elysia chlorotica]|uniref:Uncharacterized protein n=1 Tax=Elysia chlorotica TaxID=188477 RepID=A0A433STX7_ELYCH|nr:hypothetical protein EGW08_019496 [Elysia chlorotica]